MIKIVRMNTLEVLISLVAPHNCIVCDLEGDLLCDGCLHAELTEIPGRCYRCHKVSQNQAVCKDCRKTVPIRHVWVATDYGEIPKKLIYKFKFERALAASRPIARKIDQFIPDLPSDTIICHIPTANNRVRIRGYDQAAEVAKRLAKIRGYSYRTPLVRTGKSRQVGSGRKDRFKHLNSAFKVKNSDLRRANVLLIDDITTTGATIEAAAKILRESGVKTIDVAVFAQA